MAVWSIIPGDKQKEDLNGSLFHIVKQKQEQNE